MDSWLTPERHETSILVVDDNLIVVKLIVQTLTPHGLNCHWAKSAGEAQQILQAFPIDLLISDIRPPTLDGLELVRWTRAQPGYENIPVMFFTSVSERETIAAAALLGNVDYLLKPLRPRVFCERVRKRLELCS